MSIDNNNLWNNTIGYGGSSAPIPFLSAEQNARVERMRIARMLWKGHHRKAFLEERRTQFNFPESRIQGRIHQPYYMINMLRKVTKTLTNLLLVEEPQYRITDEIGDAQDAIDELNTRSNLHSVFKESAQTASWSGEAMVEIVRWDGKVWIQKVKSEDVFPIGNLQPDGQYPSYQRFATAKVNNEELLLVTTYLPGKITRQCFFLTDGQRTDSLPLSKWPVKQSDGSDLLPEESTGIEWNTIVWMGNNMEDDQPSSDYDSGLMGLQDQLNAKHTQIARVIAKHADPKLAAHILSGGQNGYLYSEDSVFFFQNKEQIPSYITWNAELAAAMEDLNFTFDVFCITAGLSKGILGLEKGATPESARKLRLSATDSLIQMKEKATVVKPFIRTTLDTAVMMTSASSRTQIAMDGYGCAVDLRDGLPVDDLDQAEVISKLTAGKPTMSVKRGVSLQIPDVVAADEEYEEIQRETTAGAPSILIGEPPTPALPSPHDEETEE